MEQSTQTFCTHNLTVIKSRAYPMILTGINKSYTVFIKKANRSNVLV